MNSGETIHQRYDLTNLLGKGGMAEVWRALDTHLGRPVAVKFLAPQLAEDPEFLVRFFAEAQAVARISHPNVVQVLDFGEHEGSPFLVMEAVEGGPLTELVGEPMDPERALEIVTDVAGAAGAAHDAGIVHRDIKPGNILMDPVAGAKLADFGIASSGRAEHLTATGAAIGSPHYISPEQASGGVATPASDVYAIGIVLYELLTGVKPFDGDNVTAIAIAHVEEQPPPPRTHVPEVAPLDDLVLRCLAKDPAARFADGNELAAALASFDFSARAAAVADEAVVPHWWATRRALATAAAGVLLIGVPIVVFGGSDGGEESATASESAQEHLPDVGGLDITPTPSPTGRAPKAPAPKAKAKPKPKGSSTKDAPERKQKTSATRSSPRADQSPEQQPEVEPTPEPTPEPTQEQSAPEPTPSPSP